MSKAKCLNCLTIIESKHRHDFVCCPCRIGSDQLNQKFRLKLEEYRERGLEISDGQIHLAYCAFEEINGTRIFLDGGNDYIRYGGRLDDYEKVED